MEIIWGGASLEKGCFETICNLLVTGSTILELGSGAVTGELIKNFKVYSIEHDLDWVNRYHDNYIYAPLCQHKPVHKHFGNTWYDPKVIEEQVTKLQYDLILIDGPPYERAGFLKYSKFFNLDVPIVFDDLDRERDRKIAITFARDLRVPLLLFCEGNKHYGVINDPRLQL